MKYTFLIDADDTLWENNIYFERAIHAFITFLNHTHLSREEVRTVLDDVEQHMGYGSANFTKSLVATYHRLAEKAVHEVDIQRVHQIAAQIHAQPLQLLAGVRETLAYLFPRHHLVLLTKGEAKEQQLKVEQSGIAEFFRRVIIVPEKEVATYQMLISELHIDKQHIWMVGNSPRSDINPALAAGINAVFIPHPHTWRLEHAEIQQVQGGRLLTLSTFADLQLHF